MAPPPLVSVIIPAYRQPSVRACLESLRLLEADGVPFDVHVVLNDVPEEIRTIVEECEGLPLVVHDCAANLGSAAAFNLAAASSTAPYLLPLQDDATVEPGLLRLLHERVQSAGDIGAAGALVETLGGSVWDVGWIVWNDGTTSPRWLGAGRDPADYPQAQAVAQHGLLAMLVRRDAWESIGGLDEAFYPLMYVDVDACVRLRQRGWRIVVEPRARARQAINGSTTVPFRDFLLGRNHARFAAKHADWLALQPTHSDDPADVARAAALVAATPVGPTPPPATADERAVLAARLAWTPEQVLRVERDLLTDYRHHLEARLADLEPAAAELPHALAREEQARAESWHAAGERDAALAERDAVHAELESIALSRTWRTVSAVRRLTRRA